MNWADLEAGDTIVSDINVITVTFVDVAADRIDLLLHSDASHFRCIISKLAPPRPNAVLYKGRVA